MGFFFIVLIIGFVLFLFRLYHVAKDDVVLVKKNVSLDKIFDAAFICAFVSLFFARVFYVLLNPDPAYLHPLVFLVFPYFPGLSLLGGVVGGILFLYFYGKRNGFPIGRVFDFFTVSLTFVLPIGLLGYFLLSGDYSIGGTVRLALFIVIALAANLYLHPKASSLEIKDGSISLMFLIFFSLTMLLTGAIDHPGIQNFIGYRENFVYLLILLFGLVLIIKQETRGRKKIKNAK